MIDEIVLGTQGQLINDTFFFSSFIVRGLIGFHFRINHSLLYCNHKRHTIPCFWYAIIIFNHHEQWTTIIYVFHLIFNAVYVHICYISLQFPNYPHARNECIMEIFKNTRYWKKDTNRYTCVSRETKNSIFQYWFPMPVENSNSLKERRLPSIYINTTMRT